MGIITKKQELTREVYAFIIKSCLHDTLHTSTDLYLTKEAALEHADQLNKNAECFKGMKNNYFLTKKYTVHLTK